MRSGPGQGKAPAMKAVVVYESMWGNTEQVARAIAAGLVDTMAVDVVDVSDAPQDPADADLLVLGGPTHAFSMSRPQTRTDAASQGAPDGSTGNGIREWIARLPDNARPILSSTFDTRVTKVRHLPGSAAKKAARELRRHGYSQVLAPESFYVRDTQGPLDDGELARARAWATRLGTAARARHSPTTLR